MNKYIAVIAVGFLASVAFNSSAIAGQQSELSHQEATALVQPFYAYLSGDASMEEVKAVLADDWKDYGGRVEFMTAEQALGFIGGPLQQMVPDLNWEILEVYQSRTNQIIVRGEAQGTPVGELFFGAPVTGRSFAIMSIDIHTLVDGKIASSYHLEDWSGALRQLATP